LQQRELAGEFVTFTGQLVELLGDRGAE